MFLLSFQYRLEPTRKKETIFVKHLKNFWKVKILDLYFICLFSVSFFFFLCGQDEYFFTRLNPHFSTFYNRKWHFFYYLSWKCMITGVYFSTNKLLVIYDSQTKDFESLILWSVTHSLLWLAFENKVLLKFILMPK